MKPYTINSKSWAFRLANFPHRRVGRDTNLCDMTSAMIRGALVMFYLTTLIGALVAMFGYSIWNTYDMIANGASIHPTTILAYGFVLAIIFIAFVEWSKGVLRERRLKKHMLESKNPPAEKQPGMITLWYRKFKDKTCVRILVEENKND
jgi:hypothetical protein